MFSGTAVSCASCVDSACQPSPVAGHRLRSQRTRDSHPSEAVAPRVLAADVHPPSRAHRYSIPISLRPTCRRRVSCRVWGRSYTETGTRRGKGGKGPRTSAGAVWSRSYHVEAYIRGRQMDLFRGSGPAWWSRKAMSTLAFGATGNARLEQRDGWCRGLPLDRVQLGTRGSSGRWQTGRMAWSLGLRQLGVQRPRASEGEGAVESRPSGTDLGAAARGSEECESRGAPMPRGACARDCPLMATSLPAAVGREPPSGSGDGKPPKRERRTRKGWGLGMYKSCTYAFCFGKAGSAALAFCHRKERRMNRDTQTLHT